MRQRAFREDLLYRLEVLVIRVPSLDEHRQDIPELVAHFLAKQPRRVELSPGAVELLCRRSWPGNVRQLRNAVDRAVVFAASEHIEADDLRAVLDTMAPATDPDVLEELVDRVIALPAANKLDVIEELLIRRALELAAQNKSAAARLLGVHRKVVERRVEAGRRTALEEGAEVLQARAVPFRPGRLSVVAG